MNIERSRGSDSRVPLDHCQQVFIERIDIIVDLLGSVFVGPDQYDPLRVKGLRSLITVATEFVLYSSNVAVPDST
ncbi:MAG: hypothetical protein U5K33_01465 [Halofilum sp. (in: g-proteobacteria)]|nr:hypothetical protein [Halofilum sp. (in: g-proteobacteria)]